MEAAEPAGAVAGALFEATAGAGLRSTSRAVVTTGGAALARRAMIGLFLASMSIVIARFTGDAPPLAPAWCRASIMRLSPVSTGEPELPGMVSHRCSSSPSSRTWRARQPKRVTLLGWPSGWWKIDRSSPGAGFTVDSVSTPWARPGAPCTRRIA